MLEGVDLLGCSPDDAARAFTEGRIGVLAMGPFIAWLPEKGRPDALGAAVSAESR
jgi:hypothetical protein